MNTFVKVSLSLDYRKADTAIKVLQAAGAEPDYAAYPVFDYLMGIALYTRADTACVPYFQRYLKGNKSDIFIKDAWAKMALAWYMAGNKVQAASCRRQIKAQGSARLDADKLAQKFGTSENWPNKKLLQSRLLIEGGYYRTADALLRTIDLKLLTDPGDRAEYFFRFGRVFEELNDNNNALLYYQYTITTGKDRHEQFAARAALQKGRIYEKTAKYPLAIACYKECLDMPAHDFQNSIDNQAKAGLNRVGFK